MNALDIAHRVMERHGHITRREFWELPNEEEREFFKALNDSETGLGPVTLEWAKRAGG